PTCVCASWNNATCVEPAPVPYAYRNVILGVVGPDVIYTCYDGYDVVSGDLFRACDINGTYTGQPPECKLICRNLVEPAGIRVLTPTTLTGHAGTQAFGFCHMTEYPVSSGGSPYTPCSGQQESVPYMDTTLSSSATGSDCFLTEPETSPYWSANFSHGSPPELFDVNVVIINVGGNMSDECAAPPVIPLLKLNTELQNNYVSGDSVRYACADNLLAVSGSGVSECSPFGSWSYPTLSCTANEWVAQTSLTTITDADESSGSVHTGSDTYAFRVYLPTKSEVQTIAVFMEGATVTSVSTLASSSGLLRPCNVTVAADRLTTAGCPQMPVAEAVQLNLSAESRSVEVQIFEVRVFGRPFVTALECSRTKTGADYKGTLATTVSGSTCETWSDAILQLLEFQANFLPDETVGDAGNFCRNPKGSYPSPMCFVRQGILLVEELCPVPVCADMCRLREDGQDYRGNLSVTNDGRACVRWDHDNIPFRRKEDFDWLSGEEHGKMAHNYCRNPGGSQSRPWCYTDAETLDYGFCDVPLCESSERLTSSSVTEATVSPTTVQFASTPSDIQISSTASLLRVTDTSSSLDGVSTSSNIEATSTPSVLGSTDTSVEAGGTLSVTVSTSPIIDVISTPSVLGGSGTSMEAGHTLSVTEGVSTSSAIEVGNTPSRMEVTGTMSATEVSVTPSNPDVTSTLSTIYPVSSFTASYDSPITTTHAAQSSLVDSAGISDVSSVIFASPTHSTQTELASVEPTPTQNPPTGSSKKKTRLCPCTCTTVNRMHDVTNSQFLSSVVESIRSELHVPTETLSSTIRAKTSAEDNRPSSVTTGIMGIVVLGVIGLLLVAADIISVVRFLKETIGNRTKMHST
ncbi:hypothetical protein BaRGS_00034979, partial [Batillaria attramentaria]